MGSGLGRRLLLLGRRLARLLLLGRRQPLLLVGRRWLGLGSLLLGPSLFLEAPQMYPR